MNWRLIMLIGLLLTGCGGGATSPLTSGDSQLLVQWARNLEANNLPAARAMMIDGSSSWEESTRAALALAPWQSHRVVELPADEKPYAPPGTLRVQWELQVPATELFKRMCTDVRERDGKIEGLNQTLPCTADGIYASGLEPLLFQPSDVPGLAARAFGGYQIDQLLTRGLPEPMVTASVEAGRADEPDSGYVVTAHLFDPVSAREAFKWWRGTTPGVRVDLAGIGEQAFEIESQDASGTRRAIIFARCNAIVHIDTLAPATGSAFDFAALKGAAAAVDERLAPAVCPRP